MGYKNLIFFYQLAQLPCACNNFPSSSSFTFFSSKRLYCLPWIMLDCDNDILWSRWQGKKIYIKNVYQVEVAIPISKCMWNIWVSLYFCHGIFQRVEWIFWNLIKYYYNNWRGGGSGGDRKKIKRYCLPYFKTWISTS